jgi:hypothetical protein
MNARQKKLRIEGNRKGGQSKSQVKIEAARKNGMRGGRRKHVLSITEIVAREWKKYQAEHPANNSYTRLRENSGQGKGLDTRNRTEWNVPVNAEIDDLVIMYRAGKDTKGNPASKIKDIWRVVGPFTRYGKRNKEDRWPGLQAGLKLVVRLKKHPVTYAELCRDRNTRDLGVVLRRFIGMTDVTDDWPVLYNKIVSLNPKAKSDLRQWHFD